MVRYFAKGLPKFVLVVVNCSRGFKTLYTILLKNITVLSGIVNVLLVSTNNFGHHYLIPDMDLWRTVITLWYRADPLKMCEMKCTEDKGLMGVLRNPT
jgi:hypothetical protein